MKSDADLTLETDRLDQLLDTAAPSQPVVVVQYRNRGVPSWIFFPLIFLIPAGALVIYHRMVVERYRVQAAEARQALEGWLAGGAASTTTKAVDPPKATAPVPEPPKSAAAAPAPPTPQGPRPADSTPATPPAIAGQTEPLPREKEPVAAPPVANNPVVPEVIAPKVAREVPPAVADDTTKVTLRSILPNPFAAPEVASHDGQTGPKPLEPLPTKEESLRDIEQEAAKKQAEIVAQFEAKQTEIRSQRIEEQIKFREELRELVRTQGNRAGPEIDSLVKRYAGDIDPVKYARAHQAWRYARKTQSEKVRVIRALELPETVILDFLSDDLHALVRGRKGPSNESEVRVRAARQLLTYRFPAADAAQRPVGGAGVGAAPARSSALPQEGGVPRPQ
jgi:hypothetical protein